MYVCVFFSPVPELALFFGMTSAETGGEQVVFSGRDRGVALFCSTAITLQQVLLNCALSAPLHGIHLGPRTLRGRLKEATLLWKSCIILDWYAAHTA